MQSMPQGMPPIPQIPRPDYKKGPPPVPKQRTGPSTIPTAPREQIVKLPSAEALSFAREVPTFEVPGFKKMRVLATLEKKDGRAEDEPNEDSLFADPVTGLLGVCDGLGGEGEGASASRAASQNLPKLFAKHGQKLLKKDPATIKQNLADTLYEKAGRWDEERARIKSLLEQLEMIDPALLQRTAALTEAVLETNELVAETKGMTTLTTSFIHEVNGKRYAIIANVGDSGAFVRRANRQVELISREDSTITTLQSTGRLSQELVDTIKKDPTKTVNLGGKDYDYLYLKRAMSNALGKGREEGLPSIFMTELEPGDELYLATDGILNKVVNHNDEIDPDVIMKSVGIGVKPKEQLDNFRGVASATIVPGKRSDDIALLRADMQ